MRNKLSYTHGLVWLFLLFVVPLPLIQALALGLPSIYASQALAIQLGSIAYVWWLAAVYLATRPRWLDRLIGLPSIYFIHGMLSILALLLAFLHKEKTNSFGLIKQTGDWAFDLFLGLMVYSLIFLAGWLTNRWQPLVQLKRLLERVFHHELTIWIHRLNLVALALVFIHVQLISYITSITAYIWLFNGYTILFIGLYLEHQATHVWRLPRAKLLAIRELAPNFVELTLQLRHPSHLQVHPGDYLFLNFPHHDGLKELHPFSVVNAVDESGRLVLAIRGDGDFTRQVPTLMPGALANVEGGFGRFAPLISANANDDLVLIAGGSGIVPMLALIAAYPEKQITLYYTAHTPEALIYANDLRTLATQRSTLTLHIQVGRFEAATTAKRLLAPDTTYLLSGPRSLGRSWSAALRQQGISERQLYYEEFNW